MKGECFNRLALVQCFSRQYTGYYFRTNQMPKNSMQNEKEISEYSEEGVDVPYQQISPATLRALIEEFVSREWSELSDSNYSLDEKVEQVLQLLREKKAKVVYDLTSETCNIVPNEGRSHV
jgi:uncharacterized protein